MRTKFKRKFFYLQLYCVAITLVLGGLFVFGFTTQQKQKFAEIDVERINVVEKDGTLEMVISNKERQHPGMVDGKSWDRKRDTAGILFFDGQGNEAGGLIFGNEASGSGGKSFTFDRFRSDQTIALQHGEDDKGNYSARLSFNDQNIPLPELVAKMDAIKKLPDEAARKTAIQEMRDKGEFSVRRVSIGKEKDRTALFTMADAKGRPRIKMSVAADGNPKLDFLDENEKVIYSLPEKIGDKK